MRILVACEESQAITKELRKIGQKAIAEQWGNFIKSENVAACG